MMKNFYFLIRNLVSLLCLFFCLTSLFAQEQRTVSQKHSTASAAAIKAIPGQKYENVSTAKSEKKSSPQPLIIKSNRGTNSTFKPVTPRIPQAENPSGQNGQIISNNESPFAAMKGKQEVISKRDAFSKHFENSDGSFTALIGSAPIHYKNKLGQFSDIDHSIQQNGDATYTYANKTNLFESYFGATSDQGIKNAIAEGEIKEFLNTKMYWEVNGKEVGTLRSANSKIKIKEDKAFYTDLYGKISAEFTVETGRRKLNYIIPNRSALGNIPANTDYLVFNEDVLLPKGWTHKITKSGILILDENKKEIYLYENPSSSDTLNEVGNVKNTVFETALNGAILTIKTKVKSTWLLDTDRRFPVEVDPTINVWANTTGAVSSTGFVSFTSQPNDVISGIVNVGGNNREVRGFARYTLTTVPAGAVISAAVSTTRIFYNSTYSTNGHIWSSCSIDPLTSTAPNLFNQKNVGSVYWTGLPYSGGANGTLATQTLNMTAISAIQSALSQGWFAMLMSYTGNDWNPAFAERLQLWGERGNLNTSGVQHKPYLLLTYTIPAGCSGTLTGGTTVLTPATGTHGSTFVGTVTGSSSGGGLSYQWESSPTGGAGTWTNITGETATTYNGTAPFANGTIYYRRKITCSNGGGVAWSTAVAFTTTCTPSHTSGNCATPGDCQYIGISNVNLGTINNPTGYNNPPPAYNYYSGLSTDIGEGTTYTMQATYRDNGFPENLGKVAAWIDWNNDGDFDDANEYLGVAGNVGNNTIINFTINVPSGTILGTKRLRVRAVFNLEALTSGDACTIKQYGETEDYNVNVVTGFSCDPVTATADKYVVCSGDTVQLTASSSTAYTTYLWYTDWNNETHSGTYVGTGQTISVNPTESRLYGVVATNATCTGIDHYALVTISVTPGPSLIVVAPVEAINCTNESTLLSVVSGGIIPETILKQTWDPSPENPFTTVTRVVGGPGVQYARWGYTSSPYRGISSPDNSNFEVVDSNRYGPYEMESSLISPVLSFTDYNSSSTNITLTFQHVFWAGASNAYVEISTDGNSWTEVRHYTTDQGNPAGSLNFTGETVDLTAYKGAPFFQIRFRYAANSDWFWAIDDVKVMGTNPLPTTVTWSPVTGLYINKAATTAYIAGTHATSVYAAPSATTTYTVSAKTAVGCPSSQTILVTQGDKNWNGTTDTNWNTATNWVANVVPTIDYCVNIPAQTKKPVIQVGTNAYAKNLTVQPGGNLDIAGNLTVKDFVKNLGTAGNLTVKSDGNLIQINPNAPNSGSINAERNVTDMDNVLATQMDYVYWSSPVTGQKTKNSSGLFDGFSPGTPNNRFFRYNEPNDNFYETGDPTFVPGKGYAVQAETSQGYAPNATGYSKTYNFRGTPNNGDISININRSPDAGGFEHGFNLVGNPYPSNINFDKLYTANAPKINSAAYLWTNNTYEMSQQGSGYGGNNYAVYNALVGGNPATHAASGIGVTAVPNGIIKVGQGFIIQKSVVGGPVALDFKNSYGSGQDLRVTTSSTFFQKDGAEKNRFWINLTAPAGLVNTQLIAYIPEATNGYEPDYDAEIFGMSSDVFYSKAGDKNVLIQGKGDFVVSDKVLLGANIFTNGNYTINLDHGEGIFASGQNIYLKDLLSGIVTNLSDDSYTFAATAGLSEGRFEIIYEPQVVLSTQGSAKEELVIYRDGNDFVVKAQSKKITYVEVYDTGGRLIFTLKANATQVTIPAEQLPNSVYIVKITQTEAVTSRKILK